MAYKLKLDETLSDAVKRISRQQLDPIRYNPSDGEARQAWVHGTRKAIKRLRALLRLVRPGMTEPVWNAENAALRDIAAALSPMRDTDVLPQTLARLRHEAQRRDQSRQLIRTLDRMVEALTVSRPGGNATSTSLAASKEALEQARKRLATLSIDGSTNEVIEEGIRRNVRDCQSLLQDARHQATADGIHDLRKSIQVHWRQMQLLAVVWPEHQSARIKDARILSQLLGVDQDISVMTEHLQTLQETNRAFADPEPVLALGREHQEALRRHSIPLATRLFAVPSRPFAETIATMWEAANELKAAGYSKDNEPQDSAAEVPARSRATRAARKAKRPPRRTKASTGPGRRKSAAKQKAVASLRTRPRGRAAVDAI